MGTNIGPCKDCGKSKYSDKDCDCNIDGEGGNKHGSN